MFKYKILMNIFLLVGTLLVVTSIYGTFAFGNEYHWTVYVIAAITGLFLYIMAYHVYKNRINENGIKLKDIKENKEKINSEIISFLFGGLGLVSIFYFVYKLFNDGDIVISILAIIASVMWILIGSKLHDKFGIKKKK